MLPTTRIDAAFGDQKTVILSRLQSLAEAVTASQLRDAVRTALAECQLKQDGQTGD